MIYITNKLRSFGLNINTVPVNDLLTNFSTKILKIDASLTKKYNQKN